jgi:hypothetical protein
LPDEQNQICEEINEFKNFVENFFKKTISFDDKLYTFRVLIEIFILMKFTSFLNDRIILLFILNIIIFYAPLEKKCPHFLFKSRMFLRQIIEGAMGAIDCLIPRYEDMNEKK